VRAIRTAFDPAAYPGPRPDGAVLVHRGEVHALPPHDPTFPDHLAPPDELPPGVPDTASTWRWSVAYGANANPARLIAKGLDLAGAVLLPAEVTGWVPVFEQRLTAYGSVPLTLVPAAGVRIETFVLGLPPSSTTLLDRSEGRVLLDRSEGRVDGRGMDAAAGSAPCDPADGHVAPPGTYVLGAIGEVVVAGHFLLRDALAYLPGRTTRIQLDADGAPRTWPSSDQAVARAHVTAGGPSRPVSSPPAPIAGPWPPTPLEPLVPPAPPPARRR
jgi:hypothetical protein